MKVVFHEDFRSSYTSDPAAENGRMEAVERLIRDRVIWIQAVPATEEEIAAVHTHTHMERVRRKGVYDIAALAAGAAIQTAAIGLTEPCFGLLEGGYNHRVLGGNVLAFLEGLEAAPPADDDPLSRAK